MSKELGQKIAIKFTEEIIGDISGENPPVSKGEFYLPTGTATASSYYSTSYQAYRAFQAGTSYYWRPSSIPAWIQIQLSEEVYVAGFQWNTSTSSYKPKDFIVQASNDGENWDELYSGVSPDDYYFKEFYWSPTQKYKYYRWNISTSWSSYVYIYEINLMTGIGNNKAFTVEGLEYKHINGELVDGDYSELEITRRGDFVVQGDEVQLGISAVTASSQRSTSYVPNNAIDGNMSTSWMSSSKSSGQYIQFDLGVVKALTKIKVGIPYYTPEQFNIEVSEDGVTFEKVLSWLTIASAGVLVVFEMFPVKARYVKLIPTSSGSSSYYVVGEFEAYGKDGFTWVPAESTDDTEILLKMGLGKGFRNVEGNLTIKYDASKGLLLGKGGPVESFTQTFLPSDLVQKLNPYLAENFEVLADCLLVFQEIDYRLRYEAEHFELTASCTLNFEYVGEINP